MAGIPSQRVRQDYKALTNGVNVNICPATGSTLRKAFVITNIAGAGSPQVSLGMGTAAQDGFGVVLQPGQSYSEYLDSAFIPWQGTIDAIAGGVGVKIAIFERY